MSFIKKRIATDLQDAEFRTAYDEEVELAAREQARRQQVMSVITAMRKAQHLSQQQLAERLKVSQARVSQMERGTESVSLDSFLQILEVLHGGIAILAPEEIAKYGLEDRLVTKGEAIGKKAFDLGMQSRTSSSAVWGAVREVKKALPKSSTKPA